jgi:hypothetical protein
MKIKANKVFEAAKTVWKICGHASTCLCELCIILLSQMTSPGMVDQEKVPNGRFSECVIQTRVSVVNEGRRKWNIQWNQIENVTA